MSSRIIVPYRVGEWLPTDQAFLDAWLKELIEEVEGAEKVADAEEVDGRDEDVGAEIKGLHAPVQELKELIENDSEVNMFFHQMFSQVPLKPPYNQNPMEKHQIRSYRVMLRLINRIMTKAPEFNKTGLVGFPINAILDWSMATVGGYAAFLNDKVNAAFKKILNHWAVFLKSEESCYVLNKRPRKGWFGKDAMDAMPDFDKEFKCNPDKPHHGFKSWDDFFIREFRKGIRPVLFPDDGKIVNNACESAPYKIQYNVRRRSRFWIKAQPYSMAFMLGNDPYVDTFVGGTVYQAFLSAKSYHRWHSPVDGTIVKAYNIDGSYYSEAQSMGFDPEGPNLSQGYITEVAARALIFIQADNPYIGLMCFMAIGMAEVSTCEITVFEGQRVKKGQQTGMFHFGGSTHCLIFRPSVEVEFDLHGQDKPSVDATNIKINERIATVAKDTL